ncbi:universal stress protein [Halobacterium salinarum]|uniref:universal stress protein n=1 Tax=Halobacterium salinarum TaxID=2242 RepID=UPI002553E7C7|nr:universal stress protein [Halobacterium salinarum]MDL0126221.1 universal stress protein [Halobacterium salinarum]
MYVPNIDEHTVDSLAESEAETIDSVLLLVGTGPHSELAAEAARAIAKAADAPVTVLHVVDPDAAGEKRADADDLLKFAEYVLGPDVTVNTELQEALEGDRGNPRESPSTRSHHDWGTRTAVSTRGGRVRAGPGRLSEVA